MGSVRPFNKASRLPISANIVVHSAALSLHGLGFGNIKTSQPTPLPAERLRWTTGYAMATSKKVALSVRWFR